MVQKLRVGPRAGTNGSGPHRCHAWRRLLWQRQQQLPAGPVRKRASTSATRRPNVETILGSRFMGAMAAVVMAVVAAEAEIVLTAETAAMETAVKTDIAAEEAAAAAAEMTAATS